MVDIQYLEKLLVLLKGAGVSSFKDGGMEILLFSPGVLPNFSGATNTKDHTVTLPINEADLPVDLRTDNINSVDTILNWSSGGGDEELPIPGTEAPPYTIPSFNDIQTHPRQMALPPDPP